MQPLPLLDDASESVANRLALDGARVGETDAFSGEGSGCRVSGARFCAAIPELSRGSTHAPTSYLSRVHSVFGASAVVSA
mmetsp:Transcript_1552/g.5020  ORF Transcript_1552/g.5020 Transcript_1552/m.5020 type:complete len:80 (-) Transcript_1552:3382-3621(-)